MNTEELHYLLQADSIMSEQCWGIFAADGLPPTLLPGGYIVNTEPVDEAGKHWIVLWKTSKELEFFDSLGQPPWTYGWDMECNYTMEQVQDVDSKWCGLYCLYFLYFRARNVEFIDIVTSLKTNSEHCVHSFLRCLI